MTGRGVVPLTRHSTDTYRLQNIWCKGQEKIKQMGITIIIQKASICPDHFGGGGSPLFKSLTEEL